MNDNLLNIERALLSSLFFNPQTIEDLIEKIGHKDFYLPSHQMIYKACEELYAKNEPIDDELIREILIKDKKFDDTVLLDILSTNPIVNVEAYIKIVKENSIKRELNKLAITISKLTNEDNQITSDVIDFVQAEIYKITQDTTTEFKDSVTVLASTLDHIQKMKERGNSRLIGIDTGFRDLNKMTSGFGEGDLVIIAARPSMGKTAFVLNILQKALSRNESVAFFSLEMPAEQLMLRVLSMKTSIPLQELRIGNLRDDEWDRLNQACSTLEKSKLFIDDDSMLNIHQLKAKLRKLKNKHPEINLAIIDYLQLMSGSSNKDRHLEVSEISRGLKMLARELKIPIIALSQLNRGLESRSNKRPMLSDLRESGAIEQDADIILFIYRDDVYRAQEEKEKEMKARADGKEHTKKFNEKEEEEAEIIIGKQRNGPTGTVDLIFQKKFTRFVDSGHVPIEHVYTTSNIDTSATKIEMPNL
ncbi:MAG: replicative DNA helicase [Campylobacterales bacterium]|nr:replicative DNA helicase [Campylobacterales bacterium]